jgi:hypothetical protein
MSKYGITNRGNITLLGCPMTPEQVLKRMKDMDDLLVRYRETEVTLQAPPDTGFGCVTCTIIAAERLFKGRDWRKWLVRAEEVVRLRLAGD